MEKQGETMSRSLDLNEVRELSSFLKEQLQLKNRHRFPPSFCQRLIDVLTSNHPCYADYDLAQEGARLTSLVHDTHTTPGRRPLVYDLRCLIVFLDTFLLDGPAKAAQEDQFCIRNLTHALHNKGQVFNPSARRLLRLVLHRIQSEEGNHLLSTLESSITDSLPPYTIKTKYLNACRSLILSNTSLPHNSSGLLSTPDTVSPNSSTSSRSLHDVPSKEASSQRDDISLKSTTRHFVRSSVPASPFMDEDIFDVIDNHPTRDLVRSFFLSESPDLPISHQTNLMAYCHSPGSSPIPTSTISSERIKSAISSCCFALSALWQSSETMGSADTYFQQARTLVGDCLSYENSLDLVQYLILVGQYFIATAELEKASEVIFLAKHKAESLGIHNRAKEAGRKDSSPETKLLGWRIWQHTLTTHRSISIRRGIAYPSVDHFCNDALSSVTGLGLTQPEMLIFEFHKACARIYAEAEDILDIEDTFRVDWRKNPIAKCNLSNLKDFAKVEAGLKSSQKFIPVFLFSEDKTISPDHVPLAGRLRAEYQLRRLFLQLRMFRPFLVLCHSLSSFGESQMSEKGKPSLGVPCVFGFLDYAGTKCLTAAHELENLLLTEPDFEHCGSISGCERLDYVYSCTLVYIVDFMQSKARLASRQAKANNDLILQSRASSLFGLLDKYKVKYRENSKLLVRMGQCQKVLEKLIHFVSRSNPSCSSELGLPIQIWKRLFMRINQPFPQFPFISTHSTPPMTFAWFDSVPADLADLHEN